LGIDDLPGLLEFNKLFDRGIGREITPARDELSTISEELRSSPNAASQAGQVAHKRHRCSRTCAKNGMPLREKADFAA
jgi:hypothetical protein